MKCKLLLSFYPSEKEKVVGILSIEGVPARLLRSYVGTSYSDILSDESLRGIDWSPARKEITGATRTMTSPWLLIENHPELTSAWTFIRVLASKLPERSIIRAQQRDTVAVGDEQYSLSMLERAFWWGTQVNVKSVESGRP